MRLEALCAISFSCFLAALCTARPRAMAHGARAPALSAHWAAAEAPRAAPSPRPAAAPPGRRSAPNPHHGTAAAMAAPPGRRSVANPRHDAAAMAAPRWSVANPRHGAPATSSPPPATGPPGAPDARDARGPWLKSAGDAIYTPLPRPATAAAAGAMAAAHTAGPAAGAQAIAERVACDMRGRSREPNLRHLYRRGLSRYAEAHERNFLRESTRRDPSLRPVRPAPAPA